MNSNRQLGEFLRSRRMRLLPEDVGITRSPRRRATGLRREEVAERAGISAEWYVKLEQGRDVLPSAETLAALGRALALDKTEQAHLRSLARAHRPQRFERERVPDTLARIVHSLPQPAYVTGQRWDVLVWNEAAEALFGFGRLAEADRNILLYLLTHPEARARFGQHWAQEARRVVSLFRSTHDHWAGEPSFEALVERVNDGCPEFAGWWAAHDVGTPLSGIKELTSPGGECTRYEYASFQANDDPTLKLALYCRTG